MVKMSKAFRRGKPFQKPMKVIVKKAETAEPEPEEVILEEPYEGQRPPTVPSETWTTMQEYNKQVFELAAYKKQVAESTKFYKSIGYEKYAGQYEPFTIPEGYKITSIEETPAGLSVSMQQIEPAQETVVWTRKETTPSVPQATPEGYQKAGGKAKLPSLFFSPTTSIQQSPLGKAVRDVAEGIKKKALDPRTDPASWEVMYFKTIFEAAEGVEEFKARETAKFERDPLGYSAGKGLEVLGLVALAINPPAALVSAGIGLGVQQAITGVTEKRFLTTEEAVSSGVQSAGFGLVSAGAFKAVSLVPQVGKTIVSHGVGRAAISSGLGAAGGYLYSGGDVEAAKTGAVFGFGFSLVGDYLARPLIYEIRARLPSKVPFSTKRLESGKTVTGKGGMPVETYVSEPLEELQGKPLRVIADVTLNPAEYDELYSQYVGKQIITAHATPSGEVFNLRGETLLKGFPSQSRGFRKAAQLYPLYSAPSDLSDEFANIYGGYLGVGEGYSSSEVVVKFGGKSVVLMTGDSLVSPKYVPEASGLTAIPIENVLGYSTERQVVTTTAYKRFGEDLAGTIFKAKGKVGTFQVKQLPKGRLGEIPILRTMFSKYSTFDVVLGEFKPVKGAATVPSKAVDVSAYSADLKKTVVSIPKSTVQSPVGAVAASLKETTTKEGSTAAKEAKSSKIKVTVSTRSVASEIRSGASRLSAPSAPSQPSRRSQLSRSLQSSKISVPSIPSEPSTPSQPSKGSQPSTSSAPSIPSLYPTIIRLPPRRKRRIGKKEALPEDLWWSQQLKLYPFRRFTAFTGLKGSLKTSSPLSKHILGRRRRRKK